MFLKAGVSYVDLALVLILFCEIAVSSSVMDELQWEEPKFAKPHASI